MSVFQLVTYKNCENEWKALYIGKQKDIKRNVYNECFIVLQEPQGKKTENLMYMEKFVRYQNSETHE